MSHDHHISDDQVAAAVDAAIKTVPVAPGVNCYDDAVATVDSVINPNGDPVDLSVADATQAALAVASTETNHHVHQV